MLLSMDLWAESSLFYVLSFAGLALALLLWWARRWAIRGRRSPSHTKPWPIVTGAWPLLGHFPLIGGVPNLVAKTDEWADVYGLDKGCYEIDLAGSRYVVVCSEERALEVFRQRPHAVQRTPDLCESSRSIGNNGVFAAEGEQWKREHRLVAAALNQANVNDYMTVMKLMVQRLLAKWRRSGDTSVAIERDLTSLTADAIAKVAMDRDYDFLNDRDSQQAKDMKVVMTGLVTRAISPIWFWRIPFIGQYLDGRGASIYRTIERINKVVDEQEAHPDATETTFLSKIIALMKLERSVLQRINVVGNVLGLFLTGTDTTAKTLAVALYILAKDPSLQQELREEAARADIEGLTIKELYLEVPRLKSFMHEIHRWYGVPGVLLHTAKSIPFCNSTLPKGTNIMVSTRYIGVSSVRPNKNVPTGMSNSPPCEFDPHRWLVRMDDSSWQCPSPSTKDCSFLPFGYGVRACPGRCYSEAMSYLTLIELLKAFTWTLAPNHPAIKVIFDLTMSPDRDVRLVFKSLDSGLTQ